MGWCETHCVRRDSLEPVVVEVEQHHLRLCSLQDQVSKLLHLQTGLEGQLQLRTFDHDVGEIEQVDLHRENNGIWSEKHSSMYPTFRNYTEMIHQGLLRQFLTQKSLTSRGSNMPFLVTMICFGCSSTGRERIRAATSSAVFHLASYRDKAGIKLVMQEGMNKTNQIYICKDWRRPFSQNK